MSKSLGNVLLVRDLLGEAPGEAIRYALLTAHYRKPLDWSAAGLAQARHALDRLYLALRDLPEADAPDEDASPPAAIMAALEDDLNTPRAFAALFALAHEANAADDAEHKRHVQRELRAGGMLLGLLQQNPETWLKTAGHTELDVVAIELLVAARAAAREARDYAEADRIRDHLAAHGVIIEDTADQTRWRLAG